MTTITTDGFAPTRKNDLDAVADVMRVVELPAGALARLFASFALNVRAVDPEATIPGSYWGDPEAGLIGDDLYVRGDTPVHSALHEGCHWLCLDAERRASLHTDACGSDAEENAVCYLQIVLADQLEGFDREHMLRDMDSWGYSFRLGSARAWFEQDAADARQWLAGLGLLG